MSNIEVKLENVKLHNKLQSMKAKEEKNIVSMKEFKEKMLVVERKIIELNKEKEKIIQEKNELEKKYYAIPKCIRIVFERWGI